LFFNCVGIAAVSAGGVLIAFRIRWGILRQTSHASTTSRKRAGTAPVVMKYGKVLNVMSVLVATLVSFGISISE
jgi:hypothetical protein